MVFGLSKKEDMKKGSAILGALLLFGLVAAVISSCSGSAPQVQEANPATENTQETPVINEGENEAETTPEATATKTFALTGENFKFKMNGVENPELRVKQGEKVRIELTVTDGFHDWVVDELNARTQQIKTGSTTSVEFVADKKGTFEYYCSIGSHRQQGMKGNVIVE